MKTRMSYDGKFQTLAQCQEFYSKKSVKSRTYVHGAKAVMLDKIGMRNTVMYPDGLGGMKMRLYSTDIIHYRPDGYIQVSTGGYNTRTTFERITHASRLIVYSWPWSRCISDQYLRIGVTTYSSDWRSVTVPFFDGMRIHETTRDIHPEDLAKIPSDRRKDYDVPSKKARAEFKRLWNNVAGIYKWNIGLGVWAQDQLDSNSDGYVRLLLIDKPLRTDEVINRLLDGEDFSVDHMHDAIVSAAPSVAVGFRPDIGRVNKKLLNATKTLRAGLLYMYAWRTAQLESKGGYLLGGSYYVSEKDKGDKPK